MLPSRFDPKAILPSAMDDEGEVSMYRLTTKGLIFPAPNDPL
jgi:hypothetical protein